MNTGDQMFGLRENGELDPLRYDGHLDAPQEVARMLADLVPVGSRVLDVGCGTGSVSCIIADTRDAKIIGIEPNSCRGARWASELERSARRSPEAKETGKCCSCDRN